MNMELNALNKIQTNKVVTKVAFNCNVGRSSMQIKF